MCSSTLSRSQFRGASFNGQITLDVVGKKISNPTKLLVSKRILTVGAIGNIVTILINQTFSNDYQAVAILFQYPLNIIKKFFFGKRQLRKYIRWGASSGFSFLLASVVPAAIHPALRPITSTIETKSCCPIAS